MATTTTDHHLSDELILSLDSFIQESAHVEMRVASGERNSDVARASALSHDSAGRSSSSSSAMIASEYVYGRATEQLRASLAAEPIHEDIDDGHDECSDVVHNLDVPVGAWPDTVDAFHPDSRFPTKAAGRSMSDGTDQSCSMTSEQSVESPLPSPLFGSSVNVVSHLSTSECSYDQRIAATLTESMNKRRMDGSGSSGTTDESPRPQELPQQFTMDHVGHFDAHFGRALYLEQLGRSFVDGSGSKSLASYRMSSYHRMSTMASDVIKQGWLMKRGEVMPSWHRRWFTLRRMPEGPMLTYSRDNAESAPTKTIDLSSTSRCLIRPKLSREHEFRVITSTDSSRREFALAAASNFELTEWVCAIQSAINAGNKSTFEGSEDFQRIWNARGIDGFLLRYGIRKCSARNHLQTRVLELNFAEQTITNSRRGESLTTLYFSDLRRVSVATARPNNEEHGVVLDFNGRHRSWPLYLDTQEARDDLLGILQKIANKDVRGEDLECRSSRLLLKTGYMERKNVSADVRVVGPHATLKGRLFVCLYENCVVLYPEDGDMSARPWYVVTLRGIHVSCKEDKCMLVLGRLVMICASPDETRMWYNAVLSAIMLPTEIMELELKERVTIRNAFHSSVARLRTLLKAKVKPEVHGPPKDQATIELMMRELWRRTFPGEEFTSNSDPRWLEIGFQRGGPASDLRSSGLIGLYCLIYFVANAPSVFEPILARTRHGVSEGNMKNYPLAIACINVAAVLTETLGFGDAGSHSAGCLPNATTTYVHLIGQTIAHSAPSSSASRSRIDRTVSVAAPCSLASYTSWDEIVSDADNHVFEDIFCLLFPVLDALFVDMGAGYMEFGQVIAAFRRRVAVIFDALPKTMDELAALAAEPCTDKLVDPSLLGRASK